MKLTDKLIKNIGFDKLLHNSYGGWFVALCSMFNIYAGIASFGALLILSIMKENIFDSYRDPKDTLAACIGGSISLGIAALTNYIL